MTLINNENKTSYQYFVKKAQPTKNMLSIALIVALVATPVSANDESTHLTIGSEIEKSKAENREGIGLGLGAIIGAVFGGPAGAFITGIAGNFIAKHVNATKDIQILEIALDKEKTTHQVAIVQFKERLKQSEQAYQNELLAQEQNYKNIGQMQVENLLMSLQFSTGSTDIAPHYFEQVNALADLLKASPTMQIDLSGYTDLQGDEVLNHNISLARVNSVKNALVNEGIQEGRITTFAYGEAQPIVANAQQEVSFYDRRVVVKLHNETNQVANNH